jgi:hypothetical protein
MKNLTDDMTRDVLSRLEKGENLCVCMASKEYAEELYNRALELLKDKSLICLYSSKTCDIAMNEHFDDVKRIWGAARLVIYTSKITVGINYDDYDHVKDILGEAQDFHFDTIMIQASNRCPNVRNTLQGHFRVRHTREPNIYLYVFDDQFNKTNAIMQTYDEIHQQRIACDGTGERGELYSTLDAYAKYEEEVCRMHYSKVLCLLLERCGYDVVEPEAPPTRRRKAKLPDVEDKLNDFTLSFDQTLDYMISEEHFERTVKRRVETTTATTIDKYYVDAVNLLKYHLNKSKLFEADYLTAARDAETNENWTGLVRTYAANRSLYTIFYNIQLEKEGVSDLASGKVDDKARQFNNRYSLVKRLLPVLGDAKMYDMNERQITEEQLVAIGKMYKALSIDDTNKYRRCFNIEINTNNELRVGKTVLTNVLKLWCGYHLDVITKRNRIDGVITRQYSYCVENKQRGAQLVDYVIDN